MTDGREDATWFKDKFNALQNEIGKVIVGQEEVVEATLVAVAAGGHVLLEGVPGLGKTMLVRTLAQALHLDFNRIQFTPDLMPADVTGSNVLAEGDDGQRAFVFRPGPIFADIVLADEINRATPKTQSALLEAMQEQAVTTGGVRRPLGPPFWVMATQNPIEQEGTYPLPEAQLDRFFFKILVGYPSLDELRDIMARTTGTETSNAEAVADKDDLLRMHKIVREVPIANSVQDFALRLVVDSDPASPTAPEAVRRYVQYGSSPRGAQALILAAKTFALIEGRYNASQEDIVKAAKPALRHRILLNFEADADGRTPDQIVEALIDHTRQGQPELLKV